MIVATYVFSLVAYMSLNWISTPPSDSYATLYDVYSMEYTVDARDIDANRTATPPIADLSILDLNSRIFH
uniref:AlNc14C40G3411 protein n=1 Tax=Albugo laibachii Nc14 TaxID=890382 RepID=F0W9F2_9STRA|nr:AlNc14C40G3411 [Albugo laibachii Nc14]|eukprot:CCA17766.1 AlNc14C40G3411 [Albugo laibachii Nc14]